MTRSRRFARISLSSARWVLPWIAVLFVSATLAYGMNTVIGGSASASGHQPGVQAAALTGEAAAATAGGQSTTSVSGTSAALADGDDVRARFPASLTTAPPQGVHRWMLYVGLNTWIPAEPSTTGALEQSAASQSDSAAAPTGDTLGVMSMTSPASTGHASPDGCCTWD
jgi:hypothetical protein